MIFHMGMERVVAAGMVFEKDGRLLVMKRLGGRLKGLWSVPEGKVDAGESFCAAAVREAEEETGLKVDEYELLCVCHASYEKHEVLEVVFRATEWRGEPKNREPHKHTEPEWRLPRHLDGEESGPVLMQIIANHYTRSKATARVKQKLAGECPVVARESFPSKA